MNVNRTVERTFWLESIRAPTLYLRCIPDAAAGEEEEEELARIEGTLNSQGLASVGTGFYYTDRAIEIASVSSYVRGTPFLGNGPDLTWNIYHAPTRDAASPNKVFSSEILTNSASGQVNNTGFDDPTIPADSWVWTQASLTQGTISDAFFSAKLA